MKLPLTTCALLIVVAASHEARPGAAAWMQLSGGAAAGAAAATPWPDAATIEERRREAGRRALFQDATPLEITLSADFEAVNRDRDPESTVTFPATISFPLADGAIATRPLKIRGRGHSRRSPRICDFVPLRLEFAKDQVAGTVFAGHDALKLGTHCRSSDVFEQYVVREWAAYRIFNLLTPDSYRVRLAKVTYLDQATKKPLTPRFRYGLFIENDDDVAKRMGGRMTEQRNLAFSRLDPSYTALMAVFEYMIGNTDMSIMNVHNITTVETPAGARFPVPYDFDYSGLVNTVYSHVDKRVLPIQNVRQRLYRGPCLSMEQLDPVFAKMRAVKTDVDAVYDEQPAFSDASRREAKAYLLAFYKTIDRPNDIRRNFVDGCVKTGGM